MHRDPEGLSCRNQEESWVKFSPCCDLCTAGREAGVVQMGPLKALELTRGELTQTAAVCILRTHSQAQQRGMSEAGLEAGMAGGGAAA